jgi:predicted TIM-barrel fold metal-dependent hydrolase
LIVDSHLHLWNADSPSTPWRRGWARHAHGPSFTAEDALREMDLAGVGVAAVMPAAWDTAGNDLVLESARRYPDRFTAFVTPDLREQSAGTLSRWLERGARGVRVMFPPGLDRSWLADGTADWLWPAAADLEIPLMVWAPGQLEAIREVARSTPRVRLVVDHLNLGMDPSAGEAAAEVDRLGALAAEANVSVKVSALPCRESDALPLLRGAVDAFGPDRVFWGSDLGRLQCGYRDAVAMAGAALRDGERDLVMGDAFLHWLGRPTGPQR